MIPTLLLVASAWADGPQMLPTTRVAVGDTVISIEIADEQEERAVGLMYRTSLAPDTGMVFVYPDEQRRSFWMKNTLVPLSIAYIDHTGVIVQIADMQPLDTRPVRSTAPAMYALEMPLGWFAEHGIAVGQAIDGLPGPSAR